MKGLKMMIVCCVFLSLLNFNASGKQLKWDIACQAYTYKEFTLSEALAEMEKLNIKFVELYSGQMMSPDDQRNTHFSMPLEQRIDLKSLLKKHHIKVKSYGVITPENETEWISLFEFANEMGIETIATEPEQSQLEMIDDLCQKYKVRIAIHNHPDPSRYWDPKITKKALEGRSEYVGVCADFGHWTRSGLDATQCLRMLEGRIFEIHMKDVNKTDKTGHAVVWGQGVINWNQVFDELRRQKFSGKFVIEHEYNWNKPTPELVKNIAFFNQQIK